MRYLRFFRVKTNDRNSIELLSKTLNLFSGRCKWCVFKYPFSRKNMYCVSVEEYRAYCETMFNSGECIFAKNHFGEMKHNELRELAIKDIGPLCDWVLRKI